MPELGRRIAAPLKRMPFIEGSSLIKGLILLCLVATGFAMRASAETSTIDSILLRDQGIRFEPEQNSRPQSVHGSFRAHGADFDILLAPHNAKFDLRGASSTGTSGGRASKAELSVEFQGQNAAVELQGENPLPGRSSYFRSPDSRTWSVGSSGFGQVRYSSLYRKTDLTFYGRQDHLEFDFNVLPGGDPAAVRMRMKGADRLALTDSGDLVLQVGAMKALLKRPFAYQLAGNERHQVEAAYALKQDRGTGATIVSFALGSYDRTRPLIIDPVMDSGFYLGSGSERVSGVATDQAGASYVVSGNGTGSFTLRTFSQDGTPAGRSTVALENPQGPLQTTAIAVSPAGQVYVIGYAASGLPVSSNAYQSFGGDGIRAFLAMFEPTSGSFDLKYLTYIGGDSPTAATELAVDQSGAAYIAGTALGAGFPTTAGAFQAQSLGAVGSTAFVAKIDPNQNGSSSLVYATLLGSGGKIHGIAVDPNDDAYVLRDWDGAIQQTPGAVGYSRANRSSDNIEITKLNAAGTAVTYSANLGPGISAGIAVDGSGAAYIAGTALPDSLPASAGAFQQTVGGGMVMKISPAGDSLQFVTYLGGSGPVQAESIALQPGCQSDCFIYVAGVTSASDFPSIQALQQNSAGLPTAFVVELAGDGRSASVSSVLGALTSPSLAANSNDLNSFVAGPAIAVDAFADLHMAGNLGTPHESNPLGVSDARFGLRGSAFLLHISALDRPQLVLSPSSVDFGSAVVNGLSATAAVSVTNAGSREVTLPTFDVAPANEFSVTDNCGIKLSAGASCTLTLLFTPAEAGKRTGTLSTASGSAEPTLAIGLSGTGTEMNSPVPHAENIGAAQPLVTGGTPQATLNPTALAFGNRIVGTGAVTLSASLTNSGTATLTISSVALSGTGSSQFTFVAPAPTGACYSGGFLSVGQSCTLNLKFTPTVLGAATGTVSLTDNAGTGTQTLALSGTGIAYPVPYLQLPSPTIATPGSAAFTLNLSGAQMASGAVVKWNGTALTTSVLSATQATAAVPASLVTTGATGTLTVTNLKPTGVISNPIYVPVATPISAVGFNPTYFAALSVNQPSSLLAIDLNGDYKTDLLVLDALDGQAQTFLNSGSGRLTLKSAVSLGASPVAAAAGDFNEDGKLDLAIASSTGKISILTGDGTGNFTASSSFGIGSNAQAIVVGDFNGDGHLDLAVVNSAACTLYIYYGNGTGTFTAGTSTTMRASAYGMVAGDFNHDGNLDLAVGFGDGTAYILLGDGAGGFTRAPSIVTGTPAIGIATGDFNEDGIPDLAIAGTDGAISILTGSGTGNFTLANTVETNVPLSSIVLGDFNGSGHLGFAVSSSTGNQALVYFGTGKATFVAGPATATAAGPGALAVADFNNDGYPDLAVASSGTNSVQIQLQEPIASVSLTAIAFPSQAENVPSPPVPATITNTGSNPLIVSSITINPAGNTGASDFTQTNTCGTVPFSLISGASCTLNITFTPSKLANESATLGIVDNSGGASNNQHISLTGTGVAASSYATTAAVTASAIAYGASAQVIATITSSNGTPTGSVTLTVGSNAPLTQSLTNGSTTFSIPGLAVGSYHLSLSYAAQGAYLASSASGTLVVNQATTTTVVSAPSISFGQTASIAVTVSSATATPSGSVTLTVGSGTPITQQLVSGVATFSVPGLSAANYALTASYAGQSNFVASSATGTLAVSPAVTTTSISSASSVSFGQVASVAVTVSSPTGTPTGSVTLTVGSGTPVTQALVSGTASFSLSGLSAGTYSLTASYAAQGNFVASSATSTLVVSPASTTTSITSAPSISFGQIASVAVTVSSSAGTPSGAVTLTVGSGTPVTQQLVSGVATFSLPGLSVGTYSLTASYAGPGNYAASSGSGTLVVNPATTTTTLVANRITFGNDAIVSVTLASAGGQPAGTVALSINSGAPITQPLVSGVATFDIPGLAAGQYSLKATYSAQGNFASSQASQTLTVDTASTTAVLTAPPITFGQAASIAVAVSSTPGAPTGTVTLTVGSNTPITQNIVSGVATFGVSGLGAGTYQLTATYSGATNYSVSSATATLTVNQAIPILQWIQPAPIIAEVPLSSVQLDATASVPGVFTYNPRAGTNLAVGAAQTLTATFSPADAVDYASGTISIPINVTANPIPFISSLLPSAVSPSQAASGFSLSLSGANLTSASTVRWNGTVLSSTQASIDGLSIQVPAGLATGQQTALVTVQNPTPTGTVSNSAAVAITAPNNSLNLNPGPFAPISVNRPTAILVADFNHDGNRDLAAADALDANVQIYLGQASGQLTLSSTIAITGTPIALAKGDFNGDGNPDIAVLNSGGQVTILLGDGTGKFTALPSFSAGASGQWIGAADFNRDGILDLVVVDPVSTAVSLYLGDGTGHFTLGSVTPAGTAPYGLAIADFNLDGILDLAVGNGDGTVSVLEGDGFGNFTLAGSIATGWPANAITSADFNEDGLPDLAVANSNGSITILTGNGTGSFSIGSTANAGAAPQAIAAGDFNGDGHIDLAVANQGDGSVSILFGTGTGSFTTQPEVATGGSPAALAVADFNNDGRTDLAVANSSSNSVSVLFQEPLASLSASSLTLASERVGASSPAQSFTITSAGPLPLVINAIGIAPGSNTGANDFTQSNTCGVLPSTLAPGTNCTVSVTLDPSNVGQESATVTVMDTSNGISFSQQSVAASGSGLSASTSASLTAPAITYGAVAAIGVTISSPNGIPSGLVTLQIDGGTPLTQSLANGSTTFTVSGLTAGTHALAASFAQQGVFAAVTTTGSIAVAQAVPLLQWPSPQAIPTGVPLGAAQLDATASVPGTFTYTPALGSSLGVGVGQALSAVFAPQDTLDYTGATISTTINVTANPVPSIEPVIPSSIAPIAAAGGFNLNLTGTGFVPVSTVKVNGTLLTSTYNSSTSMTAIVPPGLISGAGLSLIKVSNPEQSKGGISNTMLLPVSAPFNNLAFDPFPGGPLAINQPSSVVMGQFDATGNEDLAVVDSADGNVQIFLGNGAGAFTLYVTVPVGANPVSITTGDFNEDGRPDLAVVNANGTVTILIGNGEGYFSSLDSFSAGTNAQFIATADLNLDGHLDLAVVNPVSNTVTTFLGNGKGSFTQSAQLPTGPSPYAVAIADDNVDGIPDLNVGNSDGTISVYLGNAAGGFTLAGSPATGSPASAIVTGDFNEDGIPDLAVANSNGNVTILTGNGHGSFTVAGTVPVGTAPLSLSVGDFNADGHLDLAVANQGAGTVSILLGTGATSFTAQTSVTVGAGPVALAVGDFNNDGREDLAVASPTANQISVQLQAPVASLSSSTVNFGNPVGGVATAPQSISLTNNGSAPLTVSAISITPGANAGPTDFTQTNTCGSLPAVLAPGASCALNVVLTASSFAVESATLTVTDNSALTTGSTQTATLTDNGASFITTQLSLVPGPSIVFGGTTTATVSVTSPSGTPTGSVTLAIDAFPPSTKALVNGSAVFQLTGLTAGVHQLVASYAIQGNFGSSSTSGSITVSQATPTIAWANPSPITYGAPLSSLQLNAVPSVAGTLSYTPSAGSLLPAGNNQTLSVAFTPVDTTDYATASTSVVLNVLAPSASVYLAPAAFNFNNQISGIASPTQTATLYNNGTASITLKTYSIGGTSFAIYSAFSFVNGTNACAKSGVVAAGASCVVPMSFKPTSAGAFTGTLSIGYSVGTASQQTTLSIPLSGNGVNNPVPLVQPIVPSAILPGNATAGLTVSIPGAAFETGSVVSMSGTNLATQFTTAGGIPRLTATIPAGMVVNQSSGIIQVTNPKPTALISNPGYISFTNPLNNPHFSLGPFSAETANQPVAILVQDVNHDQIPDLVVLDALDAEVLTFTGAGSGRVTLASTVKVAAAPVALAAGDFNEDGKLDLAVVSQNGAVTILLGNGSGSFTVGTSTSAGSSAQSIAAADLNGDGHWDLVVSNPSTGTATILLGAGNGTFTQGATLAAGVAPYGVVVADFNLDGLPDIAVGNSDGTVSVFLATGGGAFLQASVPQTGAPANSIVVGDFNEDGIPDLALVNSNNTVSVLTGSGTGLFTLAFQGAVGNSPQAICAVDLNGDGHLDLAVANTADSTVSVLYGVGNGTFGPQSVIPVASSPLAVAVADMNNDGRVDLTVSSGGTNTVSVLMQNPLIVMSASTLSYGNQLFGTTSAPQTFTISNTGSAPLAVTSLMVHPGYDASDFNLTTNCGTAPLVMNPQTSCWVSISYTPSKVRAESAQFEITDNSDNVGGAVQYVNLLGTGLADSTSITLTSPGTITYGTAGVVTVSISSPASVPTGIISLTAGNFAPLTQSLSPAGTATFQLTGLPVGTYTLTANYPAQVQFAASQMLGTLTVQQATPAISWPAPNPITQGTPLTSAQLDASSPVAGTFVYSPPLSTVLGAGANQTLSVAFTPSDTVNYTGTSATNSISVLPPTTTLVLTASGLTFGSETVGKSSAPQTVSLINTGSSPVALNSFVISGPNASSFQFVTPAPSTSCLNAGGVLAPGASCTLDLLMTPGTSGNLSASVVITDNANSGTQQISLSGVGVFNPVPFLQKIWPTSVTPATAAQPFTLNAKGTGFMPGAQLAVNGQSIATTVQSGTQLVAQVPAGILAGPATATVTVVNPGHSGDTTSNTFPLPITASIAGVTLGTGPFAPTPVNTPQAIAVADFNRDGIPDVAVADSQDGEVLVYLGSSSGALTLQSTLNVGAAPAGLTIGDFNEDGKLDLAVLSSTGAVSVWFGDGTGRFTAGPSTVAASAGSYIASADFNGDGHLDLAVINSSAQSATILLGTGTGSFNNAATLNTGVAPYGISVADFNQDGILDLAVGNGDGTVNIFSGNGDGTFELVTTFDTGSPADALATSDFNEDGVPDLAVANTGANGTGTNGVVSIWIGSGNGFFTQATQIPVGNTPDALAVGDFNGDGHIDIAVANQLGNTVQILAGNGADAFTAFAAQPAGSSPVQLGVADFNGDGRLDLVVADAGSNLLPVLLQVPSASLSAPSMLFATQPIGTPSAPLSFTVTNSGSATSPLVISAISITPAYNTAAGDFTESNFCGTLPASLSPGASCTINVVFSPSYVALENAVLTVTDNSGGVAGSTQTVAVSGTAPLPPNLLATSQVNLTPTVAIPPTFLGLSFDWNTVTSWMGSSTTGTDTIFQTLLNNLMAYNTAPLSIRVAGDSVDTGTINASTVAPFSQLAQNLNVHYILGVNLDLQSLSLAESQASAYASTVFNKRNTAYEIGNEPDNYVSNGARGDTYGVVPYLAEQNTWQQGIQATVPSLQRFADPALANSSWMTGMETALASGGLPVNIVTQHSYIQCYNKSNPAALNLLLQPFATTSAPALFGPYAAIAHQAGAKFRMGEMNSICSGGQPGLSNNFSSALWSIDTMFAFANAGIDGVNWHTSTGMSYNAFNISVTTNTKTGINQYALSQVNPLYYGMLVFAQAAGNGAQILPVTTLTNSNVDVWATLDKNGVAHLIIINKDQVATGTLQFSIPGYNTGTVLALTASSYTATNGVTFGGQTFDGSTTGQITGTPVSQTITPSGGVFSISVSPTSAMLINLTH